MNSDFAAYPSLRGRAVFVTGGASCGDPPTELFESFNRLLDSGAYEDPR